MYVISGCPRSGTSLMMDIFRESLGEGRIIGNKFPAESRTESSASDDTPIMRYQKYVSNLQEPEDIGLIRDMNPEGFWECPFTVQGLAYRPGVSQLLKRAGSEDEPSACKVVSQGLFQSNPVYIDSVVYMLRKPESVAKSQERLRRHLMVRESQTGAPTNLLDGVVVQSPQMYIQVTLQAAQWLSENREVPLHIVKFEDLVRNPRVALQQLGQALHEDLKPGVTRVKKELDRSSKMKITHPLMEEANKVHHWFLDKNWEQLQAYRTDRQTQYNRAQQQWLCARSWTMARETTCQACMGDSDFRRQLRENTEQRGVKWEDQPCAYECVFDVNRQDYASLEESIERNHWRKVG